MILKKKENSSGRNPVNPIVVTFRFWVSIRKEETLLHLFQWSLGGSGEPVKVLTLESLVTWCRWWRTGRSRRVWWWWSAWIHPPSAPPAAAAAPLSETCGNAPSGRGWCLSRGNREGGNLREKKFYTLCSAWFWSERKTDGWSVVQCDIES